MTVAERELDIVLLGATGFTGALTAAELAARAPAGLRWALAGRNEAKLARVREAVAPAEPAVVRADISDPASLRALAESTTVLVTTVGPYALHGGPVVAACAEAGTHYLDITGEPEFVDRTYVEHHARAVETGARLVHACGFDSIPHDLGAQYTVEQLPADVPLHVRGYVRAGGIASGGTLRSVVGGLSRIGPNISAFRARRRAQPPPPAGRRARIEPLMAHRALGAWALPFMTLDPFVVTRSALALPEYGPDFSYGHYAAVERTAVAAGGIVGVAVGGLALGAAVQVPPLRRTILRALEPWEGPSAARRARGWFSVRFVGEGGGERVLTEVSGGDPGYDDTAKMLAEAALCMARDELPETAGQVTTAAAMGQALRARLDAGGIPFRVLEGGDGKRSAQGSRSTRTALMT
jgi:short subunit dehydrogenase-like uncharacterized protein